MISLLKSIIWILGASVLAYLILNHLDYEINLNYFSDSRKICQERLKECTDNVFHKGIDNAECDFQCIDPKLIIKKK
jgi:hypothetical protein